jgi:serpin B
MIFNYLYSEDFNSFIKGNNQFAIDLYKQMSKSNENIFFSPISISNVFAMLYAGTDGKTKKEIKQVFHFAPEKELHSYFSELIRKIKSNDGGILGIFFSVRELHIANGIWMQKDYKFKKEYLKTMNKYYNAVLKEVDFKKASEKSRNTINRWVEQKTKRKIKDLMPPGSISSSTRLVLTNAIYFKSKWEYIFDEKETEYMPFYLLDGSEKKVPMMSYGESKYLRYFEDEQIQIIEMDYKGRKNSMLVILPKKKDGIKDLEKILTLDILNKWMESMKTEKVVVFFPKFKITGDYELRHDLENLGLNTIFSEEADFSEMTNEKGLFINAIFHKTFIEVTETETKAASATATGLLLAPPPTEIEPRIFKADHPFIFLIYDKDTSAILFLGRFLEPEEDYEPPY